MDPNVLKVYKSPFKKLRLGKDNDGGYIIVDIPNVKYRLFLSGGIDNDISFEDDFMDKYKNVISIAFDGSIEQLPKKNDKLYFWKKYIGGNENAGCTNLHEFINNFDNIFIKMDIEGGEVEWIKSLSNEQLNKFNQIVIEFHFPFSDKEIEMFDKINHNHYLIHFHGNNACGVINHKGVIIPNVFECTYLNKKYFINHPELNKELIPCILDMPNIDKEDIYINYEPFVFL
jgi:hypothetical protein